ncbi:MAG: twin-arginine translocase TatA/TatE family subunit [Nitrospinota bacterium]|nr:twin-arginine translocase TatA/TatE family subunit [Nitrospinota bacterium]
MMGIGFPELMIILVIIMIIFGAGKLPEIGSAFGRSIKNFKKSMKEAEEEDVTLEEGQEETTQAQLQEGKDNKELTPEEKEEQERLAREKLQAELDARDKKREDEAAAFTASLPKKGSYDYAKDQADQKSKKV